MSTNQTLDTLAIGHRWSSAPKSVTLDNLHGFSPSVAMGGGDRDPSDSFHANPGAGQRMGFRTAIAWGLMSYAYLQGFLFETLGRAAIENADVNLVFSRPVYADDTIVSHADVRAVELLPDRRSRVTIDIWCENQHGARVTSGYATLIANAPIR